MGEVSGWSVGAEVGNMMVSGMRVGVGSRVAVGGSGVLVIVTVGIFGDATKVPSEMGRNGS